MECFGFSGLGSGSVPIVEVLILLYKTSILAYLVTYLISVECLTDPLLENIHLV